MIIVLNKLRARQCESIAHNKQNRNQSTVPRRQGDQDCVIPRPLEIQAGVSSRVGHSQTIEPVLTCVPRRGVREFHAQTVPRRQLKVLDYSKMLRPVALE